MYNFKEIEEKASKILNKKDIEKSVSDNPKNKKTFSFLEGPPTANAPPALHHLEVRTYKDIINKFRFMQGFNVPRKAGWDCHGLPVEVQIEKKLGLKTKKDILSYGEAKFIKDCRESVFSYIGSWEKSTERLNYLVDLKNPYATLNNEYIESVWWSLKELYNKKLLYEAHKVVPFCPRCETPLSSHEVAQGYKTVKDESVIVKFQLKEEDVKLLVFTTTPWTLPSNLAIAINKEIEYVYVKEGESESQEVFVIAKKLYNKYFKAPIILREIKGKDLLNKKYTPLFNYFEKLDAFRIIAGDFVTEEDGTGIVHMAPAFGEVDYDACRKEGLPFVQPVNENGKFTEEVPDYQGQFIKDTDKEIIIRLKKENKLFKIIKYEHEYPFCWRCDSPLMYYAITSWFIKVTAYKDRLLKLNEKINWTPKHIKEGRFGEWLKNVKDWALSRKKFWGTPLPIWRCECGHEEIIGSIEELKKRSVKTITEKEIDLHKPWIDEIKITCEKCKKEASRIPDVIDCWYDSGAATFAQLHYPFENKEEFKRRVPYDFISEAIDQTRGWFYTLHVLSTILFDDVAYKNVICAGHIVDEKGEKMSKSKGNVLDLNMVLDQVGVDATRLQFCTVDIGSSKKFGIETIKKEIMPFLNTLWNSHQFYTQINNSKKAEEKTEDLWIISRLNSLIKEVTTNLENYQIEKALLPIINFVINDFSKTYIRSIRTREDKNVTKIMQETLEKLSQMLAPYAPNISEIIFSELGNKSSVHLSDWPKYEAKKIDLGLEAEMAKVREIISVALRERDVKKVALKQPLNKVTIFVKENLDKYSDAIKDELNVKNLEFKSLKEDEVKIELDTNLTPELESEGLANELTRAIQAARKKANLVKEDEIELSLVFECKNKSQVEKFILAEQKRIGARKVIFKEELKNYIYEEKARVKEVDYSLKFIKL